ncbi:hypothetical protein NPIL_334321 [Nephila pilipes]|uniref:Uncharacterized protein n=1 Tax=Nephila pilipes TaxID=299642 RepID=A0A8X6MWE3_NEPPI|nr:hypothetical protein NPIL_334321 [Nephila pilipes]
MRVVGKGLLLSWRGGGKVANAAAAVAPHSVVDSRARKMVEAPALQSVPSASLFPSSAFPDQLKLSTSSKRKRKRSLCLPQHSYYCVPERAVRRLGTKSWN